MKTMTIESLSDDARSRVMDALSEPVLLTESGEPLLIIMNLTEEDVVDDLIVRHPGFRASIERARLQKTQGQVKTLAEIRRKYAQESE
jgi:hypothetical protein